MSDLRGRILAALLSTFAVVAAAGAVATVPTGPAAAQIVLPGPWLTVSAGGTHTCAIKQNHTLWCWGANNLGQLGLGTLTVPQYQPVQVGSQADWASVSAGDTHTCALKTNGARYCWGDNSYGQLGLPGGHRSAPGGLRGEGAWHRLDAGYHHTCGVKADGRPYCWGRNHFGQLGVGDNLNRSLPAQVSGNLWHSVSAGGNFSCGIRGDQVRFCWGANSSGQLGLGDHIARNTPIRRLNEAAGWDAVIAGEHHTCGYVGLLLYCWGSNQFGQLGLGDNNGRNLPTLNGIAFSEVTPGGLHTCRLSSGSRTCTGWNHDGQLGLGDHIERNLFTGVAVDPAWRTLSAGKQHTCGVTTLNYLYCWGSNELGKLGIGLATPTRNVPTLVV